MDLSRHNQRLETLLSGVQKAKTPDEAQDHSAVLNEYLKTIIKYIPAHANAVRLQVELSSKERRELPDYSSQIARFLQQTGDQIDLPLPFFSEKPVAYGQVHASCESISAQSHSRLVPAVIQIAIENGTIPRHGSLFPEEVRSLTLANVEAFSPAYAIMGNTLEPRPSPFDQYLTYRGFYRVGGRRILEGPPLKDEVNDTYQRMRMPTHDLLRFKDMGTFTLIDGFAALEQTLYQLRGSQVHHQPWLKGNAHYLAYALAMRGSADHEDIFPRRLESYTGTDAIATLHAQS